MKIAVLGLGRMGQAIASRLLAHEVTVWNRSPGKADALLARGAHEAAAAAAAAGADVVISSLTGDDAVTAVLLPDGKPLDTSGIVVDCSTVAPATASRLADAYGDHFVACPIAGAPPVVRDGKATLIVAGPPDAVKKVDAVLGEMAGTRVDAGSDPARAAQIKLLNNYLLLGGLALLADAVAAGQHVGLADDDLEQVLAQLPVVAPGIAVRLPKLVGSEHEPAFTVDLGRKDLGLFADVFGQSDLTRCVDACYGGAPGDRDVSAVVEGIRKARSASG